MYCPNFTDKEIEAQLNDLWGHQVTGGRTAFTQRSLTQSSCLSCYTILLLTLLSSDPGVAYIYDLILGIYICIHIYTYITHALYDWTQNRNTGICDP